MTTDAYDYFAARIDAATRAAIAEFWQHFERHAKGIDTCFSSGMRDMSTDPTQVMAKLAELDKNLMWEFGPAENGHLLAITPEWRDELIPIARAVVSAAPSLERFTIVDTRPATTDYANFEENFQARFRQPLTLSSAKCEAWHTGRVATHVSGNGTPEDLERQASALISTLLGEETERQWAGPIFATTQKLGAFGKLLGKGQQRLDPAAFADDLRAAIANARAALPAQSYMSMPTDTREMILYKATGRSGEMPRADLLTYAASHEPFANAILRAAPFASAVYSAHCESFVGLSIKRTAAHPFDQVTDRGDVEETLHNALVAAQAGGFAGSGHGTERVYIDLALTDIETGLTTIANTLRDIGMLPDAELCFLDLGLQDRPISLADHQSRRPN